MPVEAYHRPASLSEALELTDERRSSLEVVSGGTIAMLAVNEGHAVPERVLRAIEQKEARETSGAAGDDGDETESSAESATSADHVEAE